jgi:SH3-like domain-containing protein
MKKYLLPAITLLFASVSCNYAPIDQIRKDIDSIGQHFVPDPREGINSVEIKTRCFSFVATGEVDQTAHKQAIIDYFKKSGIRITDSIVVLPDTLSQTYGLITVSVANMRSKPRHSAELVSQSTLGTPVYILKKWYGWLLIRTPDNYIAWVTTSSVARFDEEKITRWRKSERVIVTARYSLVHQGIKNPEVVCDVVQGAILQCTGEEANYWNVMLPDGRQGVLHKKDGLNFESWLTSKPDSLNLTGYGLQYMGLPYLWGGSTPYGFDCSGFVKNAYFMCGIILPRDASQQMRYGTTIPADSASTFVAGDLLFFGDDDEITHVGMSLGGYEFIHESGMVKINSLDTASKRFSSYYKKSLVGVRRYINFPSQRGSMAVSDHPWYVDKNNK